MITSKHYYLT